MNLKVGIALQILHLKPIQAARLAPENGTNGWHIHCGDFSEDSKFYQSTTMLAPSGKVLS